MPRPTPGTIVIIAALATLAALTTLACDGSKDSAAPESTGAGAEAPSVAAARTGQTKAPAQADGAEEAIPASLPKGLLLAYAQFKVENGQVTPQPGPARLELLRREGGEWKTEILEDEDSNVFHKAMVFEPPGETPAILTFSGMDAAVKVWRWQEGGLRSATLWTEEFGGRFNRMRDAEMADLYGVGRPAVAIGTHDQGVFAVLRPKEQSDFELVRYDRMPNTFIHEIEIGDLNGDGTLEVYATPSEPNRLGGSEQHGVVVRYVPKDMTPLPEGAEEGEASRRTVVADLGNRHAKEIYVGDVDGDGRDELYVAVEALTEGSGSSLRIVEGVEIRRYDYDTPANQGHVVARINDRFCRFLTAGDVDGDGKKELVAAAFRSGVWLMRPGTNPRGEWSMESVDRQSSGFEHAAVMADLDENGTDELYVAADEQGELRRYVWRNGRARRETIHSRELPRSMMTWNIMPAPVSVLSAPSAN